MDKNKYAVLPDDDHFGPRAIFVGDDVRFLVPDSIELTQMGTIAEIPSFDLVRIKMHANGVYAEGITKLIYRDRITAVFPKFK